jgi:hypothetical protein
MKTCNECKIEKPLEMFYKNKLYKDGYNTRCAACLKQYQNYRRQTNPLKVLIAGAKHRAKINNIPFTLTENNISMPTHCPVLGVKLTYISSGTSAKGHGANPYSASIDRIHPEKGYTPENAIIISLKANRGKNDLTIEEIIKLADYYKKYYEL